MRTTVDIDDELMQTAMEISSLKTKKATVELALREYINMTRRQDLASMFGQVIWDGDLDQMRSIPANRSISPVRLPKKS